MGEAKGHGNNQEDSRTGWQHERDFRPFEVSELSHQKGTLMEGHPGRTWDLRRQPDPPT